MSVERLLVGERGRGVSVGLAVAAEVKADRDEPARGEESLRDVGHAEAADAVLQVGRVPEERRRGADAVGRKVDVRGELDAVTHRHADVVQDHQVRQTISSGSRARMTRSSLIRSQCGSTSTSSRYFRISSRVRSRTVSSSMILARPYAVT